MEQEELIKLTSLNKMKRPSFCSTLYAATCPVLNDLSYALGTVRMQYWFSSVWCACRLQAIECELRRNKTNFLNTCMEQCPLIMLVYGLEDRGSRVRFPAGAGNFLFTTASGMALGPTRPPIQWVPGALSLGVKRLGREADHSPPSSPEVKNAWSYTSTLSIHLHGVVLS
jgi:hypothetical protein